MSDIQQDIRLRTTLHYYRTGGDLGIHDAKRLAKQEVVDTWLKAAEFEDFAEKLESIRQVLVVMNQRESF